MLTMAMLMSGGLMTVQSILAGSTGFVLDFADMATLWQDQAKTTPVTTIGQNIGSIDSKFGTATMILSEASVVGFWTGDAWEGDGVDDRLLAANFNTLNNVSAATLMARVRFDTITAQPVILAFSTTLGTTPRFVVDVLSTGAIRILCRRLDGDALNTLSSAAGVIVAGNTYTIHAEVDYSTGNANIWVDGANVLSTTIGGTPGNTSATVSARCRMSLALSNTLGQRLDGAITRIIIATKILNAAETTVCRDYVQEFVP